MKPDFNVMESTIEHLSSGTLDTRKCGYCSSIYIKCDYGIQVFMKSVAVMLLPFLFYSSFPNSNSYSFNWCTLDVHWTVIFVRFMDRCFDILSIQWWMGHNAKIFKMKKYIADLHLWRPPKWIIWEQPPLQNMEKQPIRLLWKYRTLIVKSPGAAVGKWLDRKVCKLHDFVLVIKIKQLAG